MDRKTERRKDERICTAHDCSINAQRPELPHPHTVPYVSFRYLLSVIRQ